MSSIADVLATLFYEVDNARMILLRIGFPASRIPAFSNAMVFWSKVVSDIDNGVIVGTSRTLVEEALRMYPANSELRAILDGSPSPGAPTSGHASNPADGQKLVRLSQFISSAVDLSELKALLTELDNSIVLDLSWNAPMSTVALDCVKLLQRRGLLGDRFFELLERKLPARRDDIDVLRR